MKKIVIFCSICLLMTGVCFAQTIITLKSGTTVEGKLIEKTDDYVKIEAYDIELTYFMDEIENITYKETSQPSISTDNVKTIPGEIVIKGTVIFDDYERGYIRLTAFGHYHKGPRTPLASTEIPKPGPFVLSLPADTKEIFLRGYIDVDNDGLPFKPERDIGFHYGDDYTKPLIITGTAMDGIVMNADNRGDR